jgi:transcriptional regulator with XRE-family HTH domain
MTSTTQARPQSIKDGPEITRQRLGTALRELREERGILLADAAAELGVAPSTLSRIETGKAPTRTLPVSTPSQFDLGWLAVD